VSTGYLSVSIYYKPVLCQSGWTDRSVSGVVAVFDLSYSALYIGMIGRQ